MQRLRVKFSRGPELKFISHLDLIRLWQRVFIRSEIPLAYSAGFNPHPKISLAAPLPLGVTGEAELMDIYCIEFVSPHSFASAVSNQLPAGMAVSQVYNIPFEMPALQAQVRFAEYRAGLRTEKKPEEIEQSINKLLAMEHLPWQHQRDTGPHNYDLRTLIDDLWLISLNLPDIVIGMRLRCDSKGSGRPEQVSLAMGFPDRPRLIHRTKLIME